MIEAVGKEFLEVYWGVVDKVLKKKDAVGVVQVITIPEASEFVRFGPTEELFCSIRCFMLQC